MRSQKRNDRAAQARGDFARKGKIKTSRPAERVGSSSPGELPIESARFCRNEKKPVFPFRPGEKEKGEKYMNSVTSGMIIGREMFYQNRNEGRK